MGNSQPALIIPALIENWQAVRARILQCASNCGRNPDEIHLLAVSKTFPPAAIAALAQAGQTSFGENYVQEALQKILELKSIEPALIWHFIGPLQRNKTRSIAEHFDWIQSLDRFELAQRLSTQRPLALPALQCCIQVNISAEPQKNGVSPQALLVLAEQLQKLPRLRLRGLMAVPSATATPAELQASFEHLNQLFQTLRERYGSSIDTLSMGMSADLEAAVAAGSTLVRVGTAIFGAR